MASEGTQIRINGMTDDDDAYRVRSALENAGAEVLAVSWEEGTARVAGVEKRTAMEALLEWGYRVVPMSAG